MAWSMLQPFGETLFEEFLPELGYKASTFDPCLYYLPFTEDENPERRRGCAGLVVLDVDDFLQGGNPRHGELMEKLRGRFRFGKWRTIYKGSGEYLGRTVYQLDSFEIQISMERYINEKLRPVVLKVKDEDRVLDEREPRCFEEPEDPCCGSAESHGRTLLQLAPSQWRGGRKGPKSAT